MSSAPDPSPSRRQIARDLVVFQVKLWLEGFKDVVLMPLSLAAAMIDIVRRPSSGGAMHSVKQAGLRFERWIDLYGEGKNHGGDAAPSSRDSDTLRSTADLPTPPRPDARQSHAGSPTDQIRR